METLHARHAECARELARHAAVRGIIAALHEAAIDVLVLKGAALAHAVYPEPWDRPRLDTDLLIAPRAEQRAAEVLTACGCRELPSVPGITGQRHFVTGGIGEVIDLHTRLAIPAAFNALDEFDALWSRSRPLPPFAPARWLAAADALLHACVHRVAHHLDAPDEMWLQDIHLLAGTLDEEDWGAFTAAAGRTATRAVAERGLRAAQERFGTPIPATAWIALRHDGREPGAAFLNRGLTEGQVQQLNLRHLPTWRDRARLARSHLFPPPAYMQQKYGSRSRVLLPWWYARRILAGAPRWLRR